MLTVTELFEAAAVPAKETAGRNKVVGPTAEPTLVCCCCCSLRKPVAYSR